MQRFTCFAAFATFAILTTVAICDDDKKRRPAKSFQLSPEIEKQLKAIYTPPEAENNTRNDSLARGRVYSPIVDKERQGRRTKWRSEVVGQTVKLEGLALGKAPSHPSHMTSQRVVYEGSRMFIRGIDFAKHDAEGKLVRVTGVLKRHPGTLVRRPGRSHKLPPYFYIQAAKLEVLERVTEPMLICPNLEVFKIDVKRETAKGD